MSQTYYTVFDLYDAFAKHICVNVEMHPQHNIMCATLYHNAIYNNNLTRYDIKRNRVMRDLCDALLFIAEFLTIFGVKIYYKML